MLMRKLRFVAGKCFAVGLLTVQFGVDPRVNAGIDQPEAAHSRLNERQPDSDDQTTVQSGRRQSRTDRPHEVLKEVDVQLDHCARESLKHASAWLRRYLIITQHGSPWQR